MTTDLTTGSDVSIGVDYAETAEDSIVTIPKATIPTQTTETEIIPLREVIARKDAASAQKAYWTSVEAYYADIETTITDNTPE